jgi:hypothetical protein
MPWVCVSFTFAQQRAKRLVDLIFIDVFRPVQRYANELRRLMSTEDRVDSCG